MNWIVKKERKKNLQVLWDVFLMLQTLWGLGCDSLSQLEIEGGCKNVVSFPEEKLLPSSLNSLCISSFRISNIWTTRDFNTLLLSIHLRLAAVMNSSSCLKRVFHLPLSLLCIKEGSLLNSKLLNNKGKEWFKLAHISCIEIDDEVIKDWSEIADVSCKETDEDVNLLEEP